jgi:hypothetical protein
MFLPLLVLSPTKSFSAFVGVITNKIILERSAFAGVISKKSF